MQRTWQKGLKKSTERSQDGQEKKIIESFILELLGRYTAKILYRWNNKRFDQEYWGQLERNWRFWKKTQRRRILETIQEEKEKQEMERQRIEEQDKYHKQLLTDL